MRVGELFVALGFDVDDKKLKEFDDNIKGTVKSIAAMSAAAAAAVYAVNRFVASSVESSVKLKNFQAETGYATEGVERFYNVASMLDTTITLDQVIGGFQRLSNAIADAKLGDIPQGALFLGLSNFSNMNPDEVIANLRQNYTKVLNGIAGGNKSLYRKWLSDIGLGDFIQAIEASEEEFNKFWSLAIPTGSDRNAMLEMARAYKEFNRQFELFKMQISTQISPYIIEVLTNAMPIVVELAQNFGALATAVGSFFAAFSPEVQTAILTFIGLLIARMRPLLTVVLLTAAALNEIGKALQGKKNFFEKGALDISMAFLKSEEGSGIAEFKRNAAKKYYGDALTDEQLGIVPKGVRSGMIDSTSGRPAKWAEATRTINNNVNSTNTINIDSSASAADLARELDALMLRQNAQTYLDLLPNSSGQRIDFAQ